MENNVFAFEKNPKIYYNSIQNQIRHDFSLLTLALKHNIGIFYITNNVMISNHFFGLFEKFDRSYWIYEGLL